MLLPKAKSHVVNEPWTFLGRGQVGKETTYTKTLEEFGFSKEGQVVQYIQNCLATREKVKWINGDIEECKSADLMMKGRLLKDL